MNKIIGYARVSTQEQNLDHQINELKEYGCDEIYTEKGTGTKLDRPEFNNMISSVRNGDSIVVYKFDRLSRSTKDLINICSELNQKNVSVVSIKDNIDTTTVTGKFFFTVVSAFSQLERDLIVERTKAGLDAARRKGKQPGRKKGMSQETIKKCEYIHYLYEINDKSIQTLCEENGISKPTYYAYKKRYVDN